MTSRFVCLMLLSVIAAISAPGLLAKDSAVVAAYKEAVSDRDAAGKKKAVQRMASGGVDEEIYPILVKAAGDRQTRDAALKSLAKRSGLSVPRRGTGSGYPNFPTSHDAAGWGAWWAKNREEAAKAAKLKELDKKLKKQAGAKSEGENAEPTEEEVNAIVRADQKVTPSPYADVDLGGLDRIFFNDGSILVCYIVTKRIDLEGNTTSYRVVHSDRAGEETLSVDLIARIEEDYRK